MWTWVRGTAIVQQKAHNASVSLDQLIAMLRKSHPAQAPGTAVFLTSDPDVAPSALLHNLKHNNVLHSRNVIVTVHLGHHPAGAGRREDHRRAAVRQLHPRRPVLRLHGGNRTSPGPSPSASATASSSR